MRYRFIFVLVVVIFMSIGFLCCDNRENRLLKEQVRDLQLRLAQGEQHADTFYIRDSVFVWKERIVEVDRTDYKKQLADKELIKDLELKVSQLESESRTLVVTRDTVVLRPLNDTTLFYSDRWISFSYLTNSRVLDCEVRDSLSTFVAREYKHKFLWWKWGTKGYNVYIVSHNPHSKVEYNKFIRIK